MLKSEFKFFDCSSHLIQQCKTRQSSSFAMLEKVVEQQQALCAVLLDSQDRAIRSLLPDGPEWTVID